MAGKGGKHTEIFKRYKDKADFFMCSCNARRTPGGLIFRQRWNNMQFVTTASFLMSVYSDYLTSASTSLACPNGPVSPSQLLALAKSQVRETVFSFHMHTDPFAMIDDIFILELSDLKCVFLSCFALIYLFYQTIVFDYSGSIEPCIFGLVRWTTFLETTLEQRATWSGMGRTTLNKCTIELPPLYPTKWILHLSAAGEAMLLGLAERPVILTFSPALL